jgi:uncharacterized protein (TIGR03067 family)
LFLLAVGVLAAGAAPKDNPITHDKGNLAGIWVAVEVEVLGQRLPDAAVKKASFRFDANTVVISGSLGPSEPLPYTIDPRSKPKKIDIKMPAGGPWEGATSEGIYRFEGNKLMICLNTGGGQMRPSSCTSKPHIPRVMYVCIRKKD